MKAILRRGGNFYFVGFLTILLSGLSACSGSDPAKPVAISSFTLEPQALIQGTVTDVTVNWEFEEIYSSEPECTINDSDGVIVNNSKISISISEETPLILTCSQNGTEDSILRTLKIAVPPEISTFKVTPPAMHGSTEGNAIFTWSLDKNVYPYPDCTINGEPAPPVNGQYRFEIDDATGGTNFELSCSNSAGSDSSQINISLLEDMSSVQTVGKDGGVFTWGNVTIDFPYGALQEDTDIKVSHSDSYMGADHIMHHPISFEPHNIKFQYPVTVTIQYDESHFENAGHENFNEARLGMKTFDNGRWVSLAVSSDQDNNTLTFQTNSFSDKTPSDEGETATPPLIKNTLTMLRDEEIRAFVPNGSQSSGLKKQVDINYVKNDDDTSGYKEVTTTTDLPNNLPINETAVGDFDRDGKEDIAILGLDDKTHKFEVHTYINNEEIVISSDDTMFIVPDSDLLVWQAVDIAAGDVYNRDAKDELVLTASGYLEVDDNSDPVLFSYLWLLTYEDDAWEILPVSISSTSLSALPYHGGSLDTAENYLAMGSDMQMRVATGNLDNDDDVEIVLIQKNVPDPGISKKFLSLYILDYGVSQNTLTLPSNGFSITHYHYGWKTTGIFDLTDSKIFGRDINFYDIGLGNFDDDDRDEIAIVSYPAGSYSSVHVEILDDASTTTPFTLIHKTDLTNIIKIDSLGNIANDLSISGASSSPLRYLAPISLGDFNGDGVDEIVSGISVNYWGSFGQTTSIRPLVISVNNKDLSSTYKFLGEFMAIDYYAEPFLSATVGDVDSDGYDELVTLTRAPYNVINVEIHGGFKDLNKESTSWSFKPEKKYSSVATYSTSKNFPHPLITSGDFDGDNFKVWYTGITETIIYDPVIVLAMAAPPSWNDEAIQPDLDKNKTEYSISTSSGTSQSSELGVSLGVSIGFETSFPPIFSLFHGEVEKTTRAEYLHSETTEQTQEATDFYETSHDNDYILYTAPTYDAFIYEVLSTPPTDLPPSANGKRYIVVQVPKKPVLKPVPLDSYKEFLENGQFPEENNPLDNDVFQHTIGDPFTYQKDQTGAQSDVCEQLPCSFETSGYNAVGLGTAAGGVEMSFATEDSVEDKIALSEEWSVKTCLGPEEVRVCLGASIGMEGGLVFGTSMGHATSFKGTVAYIDEKYYENYEYYYKMYGYYRQSKNTKQKFFVLDYAVEQP